VISDARTLTNTGQPKVDDAGLTQAEKHPDAMNQQGNWQHPNGSKYQKKFCGEDRVDHKVIVGHSREHLRSGQGGE
tara:strand:+ start:238 stop:465 length:228 start_codon:yes stop_codon:yes gene_type:complete